MRTLIALVLAVLGLGFSRTVSAEPFVSIPSAQLSATPGTGLSPEFDDFVDVRPATPGLQVLDKGGHAGPYYFNCDATDDVIFVTYEQWNGRHWVGLPGSPTRQRPFALLWDPPFMFNNPADRGDTLYFRCYANFDRPPDVAPTLANGPGKGPVGAVWQLSVVVIDGGAPSSCISLVDTDNDLSDGAWVKNAPALVAGWFTDNDHSPSTCDVRYLRFEYTPLGKNQWTCFASAYGDPLSGTMEAHSGNTTYSVFPTPIAPDTLRVNTKWDCGGLAPGNYGVRLVAVDVEGNSSVLTACVFTVVVEPFILSKP